MNGFPFESGDKMKEKSFTLIELLIAVAIIGILSSIAVPNFLCAMTRSKVARAQADMNALYTAIESYRIDRNEYPSASIGPGLQAYNFCNRLKVLTTPVSYLSAIPEDPFPKKSLFEYDANLDMKKAAPGAEVYGYFRSDYSGPMGNYDFGKNHCMLSSSGPDGCIQYLGYFPKNIVHCNQLCSICCIDLPSIRLQAVIYDLSNGVVSSGEIIRWNDR